MMMMMMMMMRSTRYLFVESINGMNYVGEEFRYRGVDACMPRAHESRTSVTALLYYEPGARRHKSR